MAEREQQFTRTELEQVLGVLDADAQALALGALDQFAIRRGEAKHVEAMNGLVVSLFSSYRRCQGGSDSNIESWHEDMGDNAVMYLHKTKDVEPTESILAIRNFALTVSGVMQIQRRDDLDERFLELTRTTTDDFVDLVKKPLSVLYEQRGGEPLEGILDMDPESFLENSRYWCWEWDGIISQYAAAGFEAVAGMGLEIPELDDNGLLPEEAEDYL